MPTTPPVVHSDPDILGGTPVFVGTRVPFQTLLDYLEAGDPLAEFLEDFPDGKPGAGGGRSRAGQGRPSRPCAFCLTSVCPNVS